MLHHIPDHVPNKERYQPFDKLYGSETSEHNHPLNPMKQTALNVGKVVNCEECSMWRLLHAKNKSNAEDLQKLEELLNDVYLCGSSFGDLDSESSKYLCQSRLKLCINNGNSLLQYEI